MFNPISPFIDFETFAPPPRLFQPPWLLERWEYSSFLKALQQTKNKIFTLLELNVNLFTEKQDWRGFLNFMAAQKF